MRLIKIFRAFIVRAWNGAVEHSPQGARIRRRWLVFMILVIIGLWVNAVLRANRGHGTQYDDFTDFSKDLLYDRINIYDGYAFERTSIGKYPPFFGIVYGPLVPFPVSVGAAIWFALNLTLAVFASMAVARIAWFLSGGAREGPTTGYWAIPLAIMAVGVVTNLETSQVNIFIFSLVVFGLDQFARNKEARGGFLLGVATAVKLTPGLFIVYFLYKRSWKTVFWAGLGVLVCWGVVLPIIMGPTYYFSVMQSWIGILSSYLTQGTMAEGIEGFRHTNQSLSAAFYRYFTDTPANGGIENFYLNFVSIPYPTAATIIKVLKIAILLSLAYLCRAPITDKNDARLPLELSLVMIATLFISPISWINHYVVMMLPFGAAVYYVKSRDKSDPSHRRMLNTIIVAGILIAISPRILQAFSFPFFGALILSVAIARAILSYGKKGI